MQIDVSRLRSTPEGYFTTRWGQPEYTDWIDETNSWKEACYIGDWSFLWERRFEGPDVLKLFSDISVNSFAKFDIGQSKHVIHCDDDGKVIHEGILSRLGAEEFMLFGRGCFWADYKLRHGNYRRARTTGSISRSPARSRESREAVVARREVHAFRQDQDRRLRGAGAPPGHGRRDWLRAAGADGVLTRGL
jgi:glycine cleavage system aminomethyltransferase T